MPSLINLNKTVSTLQTMGLVQSAAKQLSAVFDTSKLIAGTVYVKMGRTTAGSLTGAPVFRIEATGDSGSNWFPVFTWTAALHNSAANTRTLSATAAIGAVQIRMATGSLNSANSSPICVYNTGDPTRSEVLWMERDAQDASLTASIQNTQTSGNIVSTFAEEWSIPINLEGVTRLRFVTDNVHNGVTQPIVVQALIITTDAASAT